MSAWSWILLSGIPSSHPGGTGQLMKHLESEILKKERYDGTVIYSPDGEDLGDDQFKLLSQTPKVVVFHPQMIGVRSIHQLLSRRSELNLKTHLYMLDSFLFCRRSYNHLDTEASPCLRCVGSTDFSVADQLGCVPWPKAESETLRFITELKDFVTSGAVCIYTQNRSQTSVAKDHFGRTATVEQVGLWCSDWDEHFDHFDTHGVYDADQGPFDIVYHGSRDLAKGLGWVFSLAAKTPDLRYLIPVDRGEANFTGPPNTTIRTMRWDDGLFDAIKGARMTLAPSLWSAPCEGALIKSIVTSRACAVVENPSAFSGEIPDDVVLKLPPDPAQAEKAVSDALANDWGPDENLRREWVGEFKHYHRTLFDRIID